MCWGVGRSGLKNDTPNTFTSKSLEPVKLILFGKRVFSYVIKDLEIRSSSITLVNPYLQIDLLRFILLRRHPNNLQNMHSYEGKFGQVTSNSCWIWSWNPWGAILDVALMVRHWTNHTTFMWFSFLIRKMATSLPSLLSVRENGCIGVQMK